MVVNDVNMAGGVGEEGGLVVRSAVQADHVWVG